MPAFFTIPIWLGFTTLAFPLVIVSLSTLNATEIYEIDDDPEADVASRQSMLEDELDHRRLKLGFADDLNSRLAQHRTAAPTAVVARSWP